MKKHFLKLQAIIIAIVILSNFNVVLAANTNTLKNEKESNNQEITNAQSNLKEVQKEKSQAMGEVEKLEEKSTSYETKIE